MALAGSREFGRRVRDELGNGDRDVMLCRILNIAHEGILCAIEGRVVKRKGMRCGGARTAADLYKNQQRNNH